MKESHEMSPDCLIVSPDEMGVFLLNLSPTSLPFPVCSAAGEPFLFSIRRQCSSVQKQERDARLLVLLGIK